MDLNIEIDWKKVIEDSCGNDGVINPASLYTAIADVFPFLLAHKLAFLARNDDDFDQSTRSRAAFLLQDIADHPRRLHDAYSTVDRETTLPYLRHCSFFLMVDNDDKESPFHKSGKALVKKLITLALEHGEEWEGFLKWVEHGFSGDQPLVWDLILDIFCEVGSAGLRVPFTRFLEPIVKQNYEQFRTRLIDLLLMSGGEDGVHDNDRGFKLLLCFYPIFLNNKDHQISVMEAAIMSPIFDYGDPHPHHDEMIFAVICIKACIEYGTPFNFSYPMIHKLIKDIVIRLNVSCYRIVRSLASDLLIVIAKMISRIHLHMTAAEDEESNA